MSDTRTMRVRSRQISILEKFAREQNRPIGNMLEQVIDAGFASISRQYSQRSIERAG
jgi:hypothetical protein